MSPRTPAFGIPITHAAIESLREDLRIHSANDERDLTEIRQEVRELRGDMTGLVSETSGQTVTLHQIQSSLSIRAQTETDLVKYNRKKSLVLYGTLATTIGGIIGAIVHHFL